MNAVSWQHVEVSFLLSVTNTWYCAICGTSISDYNNHTLREFAPFCGDEALKFNSSFNLVYITVGWSRTGPVFPCQPHLVIYTPQPKYIFYSRHHGNPIPFTVSGSLVWSCDFYPDSELQGDSWSKWLRQQPVRRGRHLCGQIIQLHLCVPTKHFRSSLWRHEDSVRLCFFKKYF